MTKIDPRLVRVKLQVNDTIKTYEDIYISASGTKYANALQNECQIKLINLNKQTQDYILTETSPYTLNHSPKTITLEAGRESYGYSTIYVGNVVSATIDQPPDIAITMHCLTGNFQNGNVLSRGQPSQISLNVVSKQLAQDLNTSLTFQATNKNLSNYIYSGALGKQVSNLGFMGGVNIFIDDTRLIVKDQGVALTNTLIVVSAQTGMLGIPELTEQGIRVKFYLDNKTTLGGALQVISDKNPAANGIYVIYKLGFEVSNRENAFYWIAEAARQQ